MTNKKKSAIALRASVGLSVLMVGCAAAVGAAEPSAPAPAATATSAFSSEAPAPSPAPSSPTRGGALPVVPVGGGACIAGLNCGCIRYITCPGTIPHHHPAPANDHPPDAPGPGPGPGGG